MVKKISISALISLAIMAIYYYFVFPAITPINIGFWGSIIGTTGVFVITYSIIDFTTSKVKVVNKQVKLDAVEKGCIFVICACLAVMLVGGIISSKLFRSKTYANVLKVETSDFTKEINESEEIGDIALMDSDSASIIGNRAMGALTDLVSQFEVSENYSQIDYNGKPMKVAPLEYAGFFKWVNNRSEGIPGYILVDPIENTAKYVETSNKIKYSPSGCFNDNLYRHLQFKYPTKLFGECYFEIDNEGAPYWICQVLENKAGLFGAQTVKGCVIMNASTGDCDYYNVGEVPKWVDIVFDGYTIEEQYDWYGTLSGGYWNSVIGNKGCKVTTDDFGYKVMDGDVWIYTGITSVNGDESNIGFILVNSRTAECKYFEVSGAEEYSAMAAAEGEVQNLGYKASFPSLINVMGEPTYIMVLKDDGGLVKQYALVNVKKYNVVATATSQKDVMTLYKKLLRENNIVQSGTVDEEQPYDVITINEIRYVTIDGNTIVYIKSNTRGVYKQEFAENEDLIRLYEGQKVKIYYDEKDEITQMVSFEIIPDESVDLEDLDYEYGLLDEEEGEEPEETEESLEDVTDSSKNPVQEETQE